MRHLGSWRRSWVGDGMEQAAAIIRCTARYETFSNPWRRITSLPLNGVLDGEEDKTEKEAHRVDEGKYCRAEEIFERETAGC